MVRVRYFAAARELAGRAEEDLELERGALDGPSLLELLAERHPRLRGYAERMRLAVNGELAARDARIEDGDEVDVLPPVAGGAPEPPRSPEARIPLVAVRSEPLSLDECMQAVAHPGAGGVALFTGVVRNEADGRPVARLDYEAHPTLAIEEMRRVLRELAGEMPGVRLAAAHRVGELHVGDLAVVIAASAPHRAEAFEACCAAIDRIKETVPIWKKEHEPSGEASWVNLEES